MILAVAATPLEMDHLQRHFSSALCKTLVCGVGPVESCLSLTRKLIEDGEIGHVINFGIAGAFVDVDGQSDIGLLDLCLAETEILGDLGICYPRRFDRLSIAGDDERIKLDAGLRERASDALHSQGLVFHSGHFVTVSGVSGTRQRGAMLKEKYDGLCENMEGAALARVCQEFGIPFLELRAISNLVADRNTDTWRMAESCEAAARATALILKTMVRE